MPIIVLAAALNHPPVRALRSPLGIMPARHRRLVR
jgi:hypothetical protein